MQKIVNFAICLSFLVVLLGAYTRLSDAGLGCPDWPGCYGQLVLPKNATSLEKVQVVYPQIPIESVKAWKEMIHRYAAAGLGLVIFCIGLGGLRTKKWQIPLALMVLVIVQALLGMWTVTMKLMPLVVMTHLIGGMLIFSLLCLFRTQLTEIKPLKAPKWSFWVKLGLALLSLQIALGGWVSSNYAGIACIGFPTCNGQWVPHMDIYEGFNLQHMLNQMGMNHQGGLLESSARVAIQFVHRFVALVTALYLIILSIVGIAKNTQKHPKPVLFWLSILVILLVLVQLSLGVINVLYLLPLPIAVAHNGIATLLFASMLIFVFLVRKEL